MWGHTEILQFLIENGANADLADNNGFTPLHWVVIHNKPAYATVLLSHGVALNAVTTHGWTALWGASWDGHLPIVKLLVEAGADIDRADNHGMTPRAIATKYGHAAVAKYLQQELNWRRRFPYAAVLHSVKGAPTLNNAIRVLQCNDTAREIGSFL